MSLLNAMLKNLNKNQLTEPVLCPPFNNDRASFLQQVYEVPYWLVVLSLMGSLIYLLTNPAPLKFLESTSSDINSTTPVRESLVNLIQDTPASILVPIHAETLSRAQKSIEPLEQNDEPVILNEDAQAMDFEAAENVEQPQRMASELTSVDDQFPEEEMIQDHDISINPAHLSTMERQDLELSKAIKSIEQGERARAIERLDAILFKNPEFSEAREVLARVYLLQGDLTAAQAVLDEGLMTDPNNLNLSVLEARLFTQQGHYQEALSLLQEFNPNIKNSPEYYALLAATLQALGRSNEAGGIYQSLIKLDPGNGQYWLGLGIALENKNAIHKAIQAYQQARSSGGIDSTVRVYANNRLQTLQG